MFHACRCVCQLSVHCSHVRRDLTQGGRGTRMVPPPSEMWPPLTWGRGSCFCSIEFPPLFPILLSLGLLTGEGWFKSFLQPSQHRPWTEDTPQSHPMGVSVVSDLTSAMWPWAVIPLGSPVHRMNCRTKRLRVPSEWMISQLALGRCPTSTSDIHVAFVLKLF